MGPRRLTQRLVERLSPGPRPYAVRDAEVRGLMVVVQPSGRRAFHVQVDAREALPGGGSRLVGTRRRRVGDPDPMDVSVARQRARELIAELRRVRPPTTSNSGRP